MWRKAALPQKNPAKSNGSFFFSVEICASSSSSHTFSCFCVFFFFTDHYAIIPTGQGVGALKALQGHAVNVYEAIVRRFLAAPFYLGAQLFVFNQLPCILHCKDHGTGIVAFGRGSFPFYLPQNKPDRMCNGCAGSAKAAYGTVFCRV